MTSEMRDNLFRVVTFLNIIIYARLSKEEEGKNAIEQSKSIQNQIEICKRYIKEEEKKYPIIKFNIVAELYDDGISGTTFDRNDFKELIKMIESKQANMVITKDQSRFGREHIESDTYMEKWFPEHNVRYVAVLDGVDTYVLESANNDMAPIKNWMNEMYAKHTSRSVKATKKKNALEGIWNGGEPPLGFQIDPNNPGKLIIEPKGADVVKLIFTLALKNKSLNIIQDILIENKIPVPTIIKGNKRNLNLEIKDIWSTETIKEILQNEMYTGTMVQGKTTTLSYKSKKTIYLPKEDWIRIPNKVPVIIEQNQFDNAQLLIASNKNKTKKSHDYLLKGLLRCKECNHSIGIRNYNNKRTNKTICNYYRKYGSKKKVCTEHKFNYEEIEKKVIQNIKDKCLKYVDSTNFIKKLKEKEQSNDKITKIKLKIDECTLEIKKLNISLDKAYKRLDLNIIDEEQYIRLTKEMKNEINYQKKCIKRYKNDLRDVLKEITAKPEYTTIINDFLSLKNPNKMLISKLIEVIYIDKFGTIDIHYKVQNPCK